MSEIKLHKRVKYAGDVHAELLKLGWDCETAALFCDNIPDADAVEVVRCKDCKHYKPQHISEHWNHVKKYCMRCVTVKVSPDDFCSFGERRDDDENL